MIPEYIFGGLLSYYIIPLQNTTILENYAINKIETKP